MNKTYHAQGWTLVELMITVAIVGVLTTMAVPAYNSYISTSQIATARANADQLALFQEAFFYENNGVYQAGTFDPTGADDGSLTTALQWQPSGDRDLFSYVVTTGGCTAPVTQCYAITVTQITDPTITATISRP